MDRPVGWRLSQQAIIILMGMGKQHGIDRPCRGAGDHGWDGTLLVVVTANSLDFCYAARLSRLRVLGLTALAERAVTTTIRCRSRDVSTLVTSEN